jgi:3'(2'), 5'-bisphosphate nucleotidase
MQREEQIDANALSAALSRHMPAVLRWCGALARQLRKHNIAVGGKHSGSANTDALTLADLSIQELIVGALRDLDPQFRRCRIEAEETTGDLARFSSDSDLVLAIDPIDGTKQYRDRTGDGYAVMLHLRNRETVLYSLVFVPESGPDGAWVEVRDGQVFCGSDDPSRPAAEVLRAIPAIDPRTVPDSKKIYLIGFQHHDPDRARDVTNAGLEGFTSDTMGGCVYELESRGIFGGSLIHSPNVYDFPVSLHIMRVLGGDAVWVHNRQPVHFRETWLDERAKMIRLPGIVACARNPKTLDMLCRLARDWNPNRYSD